MQKVAPSRKFATMREKNGKEAFAPARTPG